MAREKYLFNSESLSYKKVESNIFSVIFKQFGAAIVIAIILTALSWYFFDSPKERRLKRQNRELEVYYDVLNKRIIELDNVLRDIEERDDNIYRAIFEAEPVAEDIRRAGYGGTDRYEEINNIHVVQTAKRVDSLSKRLVVQSESFDELIKLVKRKENMLACIPAIQPIPNRDLKHMPYGYGMRIDPVYKTPAFHHGMDFSAPIGTEIYATGDGEIIDAKYSEGGYGKKIDINHGYEYVTRYAHLSKILVKVGQKVKRGEIIGYVGNSGKSTGPHLHYEVLYKDKSLNPIHFYYNDLTPEQYEKMIDMAARSGQAMD